MATPPDDAGLFAAEQDQRRGKLMALFRALTALSQEELAAEWGISREAISNYERGIRTPVWVEDAILGQLLNRGLWQHWHQLRVDAGLPFVPSPNLPKLSAGGRKITPRRRRKRPPP